MEVVLSELAKYLEYTIKALDYCLGIQFHVDYDAGIVHIGAVGSSGEDAAFVWARE